MQAVILLRCKRLLLGRRFPFRAPLGLDSQPVWRFIVEGFVQTFADSIAAEPSAYGILEKLSDKIWCWCERLREPSLGCRSKIEKSPFISPRCRLASRHKVYEYTLRRIHLGKCTHDRLSSGAICSRCLLHNRDINKALQIA